ncbi:low molecular weight protein-tyrosine-phosphatase [Beggiatoa leptomitoformis]|uniref:protein-tyrosine-phosphatase n=1 Tax=Beggiatoa leptomitoformis TaxID=288004 RepID=A0A2N9YI43_9GAMM|nr:low molecular weight protein-tyrosine-phosphatase [Beggiatoa leptomitoformis]ALG67609.1 low molecular weight phosphotyrosine protein phosphatase [Beggiatoa leptomitoformis]AUI70160.1 low molecular weight phosphotyrosine protein phosphatase [Beggiatoa leptomitoformis]
MIQVLFVCMGNICRSPTAEGVFRYYVEQAKLADDIKIDSAGTHAYHVGEQPDSRSQMAALKRGFNLSTIRARQVHLQDFTTFDYVLAMDKQNHKILQSLCPPSEKQRLHLFLDFAPQLMTSEVPDPYYGQGQTGFEHVLNLVEAASKGLLDHLRAKLNE